MQKPLPPDDQVKLQFVATLDAWVLLEHALCKLFYVLLKPIPFPKAGLLFDAINGFQAQREAISTLAEVVLNSDEVRDQVDGLLDRARKLATKRNRIVHGKWEHLRREGKDQLELFRIYPHQSPRQWGPESPTAIFDVKGRLTFFIDDLKRCETEFRALADDVNAALYVVGTALGVSPHIELPAGAVRELKIQESPPSDRPPESL